MAKTKELYVCDQCGGESLKWQGQCPACGAWNSLTRFQVSKNSSTRNAPLVAGGAISKRVDEIGEHEQPRISTGMGELDRVLGGGLVPGSIGVLIGIGVSTYAQSSLSSLLYEVQPVDILTFIAASGAVMLILLFAIFWPARRAALVEPQAVLHYE